MWEVVKVMLKAQAAVNVDKYTGKNSLSDFLRTFDIKYPRESWSNRERRDILVTLLDGPAKLMYSNLPKGVQRRSIRGCSRGARKVQAGPMQEAQEGRRIHSDSDRDFLLGSKLQACLSEWEESYHLLAALEAPYGLVYQSVRKAALRLERAREAMRKRAQLQGTQAKDRTRYKAHDKYESEENENKSSGKNGPIKKTKCFKCGGMGHYARNCPRHNVQEQPPHTDDRQKRKLNERKISGSFSAHLEKWCSAVTSQDRKTHMGNPFLCKVHMLGMVVDAMIDTGSVVSIVPLRPTIEGKGEEDRSGQPGNHHGGW
ncbi:zinc knuckle [Ostertagia ostertagi]